MAGKDLKDLEPCVVELLDNDADTYARAARALLKILGNIANNFGMEKFRKIKLSSLIISEQLLPANGGLDCLFACGFVEVIIISVLYYWCSCYL